MKSNHSNLPAFSSTRREHLAHLGAVGLTLISATTLPKSVFAQQNTAQKDASTVSIDAVKVATELQGSAPAPTLAATAWVAYDVNSAQYLGANNLRQSIEPASITKIMTAYIVFGAIKAGKISTEQEVVVSKKAAGIGGSRMFLVEGKMVKVIDLIRGMIIQSGNDAAITLAEALHGTEEAFVAEMNNAAKKLGMQATRFKNATGLPDPEHLTTVADLVILADRLMVEFPEHYAIYKEKEFTYNGITQQNRNRLLFKDASVDGFKTGHTNSAGFCLVASAIRGGRRILTVLVGAPNDNARSEESLKLMNWAFQNFETHKLYAANQAVLEQRVWKGVQGTVSLGSFREIWVSVPRGTAASLTATVTRQEPVMAPIESGAALGHLVLKSNAQIVKSMPLVALSGVSGAGIFGRAFDAVRLWFN